MPAESLTHVALLRAVNLAGHKMIGMADLCALLGKVGFSSGRSLLQSGNLVFRSEKRTAEQIEKLLEAETAKRLSLETDFFVRTDKEWKEVMARNPFRKEAKDDPAHLLVTFLKNAPAKDAVAALQAAIVGREVLRADGRHLYIVFPDGVGRSRLTLALMEKKLGTRGTSRNWNTVMKLGAFF